MKSESLGAPAPWASKRLRADVLLPSIMIFIIGGLFSLAGHLLELRQRWHFFQLLERWCGSWISVEDRRSICHSLCVNGRLSFHVVRSLDSCVWNAAMVVWAEPPRRASSFLDRWKL